MIPLRRIIESVSRTFQVPAAAILSMDRCRKTSRARWAAAKLLHDRGLSSTQVARRLNLIDHTSVLHALKRIPELPLEWHTAYAQAKEMVGAYKPPVWRIVYNRPIGPPENRNKINCGRPNAPMRPLPPHPDDLWMKQMHGMAFVSIRTTCLYSYQEDIG